MSDSPKSGLEWLKFNFPWTDNPQDEGDKLTNAIHHHAAAGLEYIESLEKTMLENLRDDCEKAIDPSLYDEDNCVETVIFCNDNDEKMKIGSEIHKQLVGNPDYIDSKIVLCVDQDRFVRLIVGNEAKPIKIELNLGGYKDTNT